MPLRAANSASNALILVVDSASCKINNKSSQRVSVLITKGDIKWPNWKKVTAKIKIKIIKRKRVDILVVDHEIDHKWLHSLWLRYWIEQSKEVFFDIFTFFVHTDQQNGMYSNLEYWTKTFMY